MSEVTGSGRTYTFAGKVAKGGMWSVRGDGRVILSPQRFTENGPEGLRLEPYAGRLLQFAADVTLRPKPDYFGWHRVYHGMRL